MVRLDAGGFIDRYILMRRSRGACPAPEPSASHVIDFPSYICLEVTNSCNLRCIHCLYQGTTTDHYVGNPGLINVDLAKKVLDELGVFDCGVMLNGDGESLLHPDFLEIARYAVNQHLPSVYFNTNATRLTPSVTDELVGFFKGTIQISLDGFKDSHERIRVGSHYEQTIGNVNYLLRRIEETKAPISITVSYCRYDQPEEELMEFVHYWAQRVDSVSTAVVYDKDYRVIAGDVEQFSPKQRVKCEVPWETLIVRWNGKVIPCSNCFPKGYSGDFILGDAGNSTLASVWKGEAYRRWREMHDVGSFKDTVCERCERWRMSVHFPDAVEDGLQVQRTGVFTTYRKPGHPKQCVVSNVFRRFRKRT